MLPVKSQFQVHRGFPTPLLGFVLCPHNLLPSSAPLCFRAKLTIHPKISLLPSVVSPLHQVLSCLPSSLCVSVSASVRTRKSKGLSSANRFTLTWLFPESKPRSHPRHSCMHSVFTQQAFVDQQSQCSMLAWECLPRANIPMGNVI